MCCCIPYLERDILKHRISRRIGAGVFQIQKGKYLNMFCSEKVPGLSFLKHSHVRTVCFETQKNRTLGSDTFKFQNDMFSSAKIAERWVLKNSNLEMVCSEALKFYHGRERKDNFPETIIGEGNICLQLLLQVTTSM